MEATKKKKVGGLLGFGMKFNNRMKLFAVVMLLAIATMCVISNPVKTGMYSLAIAPIALVTKIKKKAEETGVALSAEDEALLKLIEEGFADYAKDAITEEELDAKIDALKEQIKATKPEEIAAMEETIKAISKEVKEMKDKGLKLGGGSKLEKAVDEILNHPKVKEFFDGKVNKSGKVRLKDIVSLTNDYTGDILISQQTDRVEAQPERRTNIRDVIMVDTGDPSFPAITYTEITELDRNAASVSENGRLPKSSFKVKEVTDSTKRIGTYVHVSKRLLKSRIYLKSFLMNRLPKWVRLAEDFQILFGDGNGDNLEGIAKRSLNIVDWLTSVVVTGVAGDVASVESYDGGAKTIITFNQPFSKIEEGQMITFTGAPSGSVLLSENILHKYNDRKIMLDVAYTSLTTTEIAALAFTVKNNFFNDVPDPHLGDAIEAIFSILTYGEYTPNVIVLNPSTVFHISTLKDTTGRNLDLITRGADGRARIGSRLIVESTGIAPGFFFAGDLQNAVALVDYTSLEVEFVEDAETKLTNSIIIMADEEVILQVFNKFACAYGKLKDVLTAISA